MKLFENSPESRAEYPEQPRYDRYPYIRFLEDFFEILPEICISVPDDLYSYIETHEKRTRLIDAVNNLEDWDSQLYNFPWFGRMDTGYLAVRSHYAFNLRGADIHISYDFQDVFEDGLPVWSAGVGSHAIPYEHFLWEVEDLLNRFFTDMETQVAKAERFVHDPRYCLYDGGGMKSLIAEHEERKYFFYGKLQEIKSGNFDNALDCDAIGRELKDFVLDD